MTEAEKLLNERMTRLEDLMTEMMETYNHTTKATNRSLETIADILKQLKDGQRDDADDSADWWKD